MKMMGLFLGFCGFCASVASGQTTRPVDVIVHEWGTFTNFAGADGVYLDFRPLVSNDLPEFVFDRGMQAQLARASGLTKLGVITRTRMETPVTYFYVDQPAEVKVRVDMPRGLLTDFYPPVREMGPAYKPKEIFSASGSSFLDWGTVMLTPEKMMPADTLRIPKIKGENHYAAARETDSAIVSFYDARRGYAGQEKFLFYRGIGSVQLPLGVQLTGGRVEVTNGGTDALSSAVMIDISGGQIHVAVYHDLKGTSLQSIPTQAVNIDQLGDLVSGLLVKEGLYEKEARAMVKTWRSSWFGEEGTRLLYMVPRRATDALIPLQVTPTPKETVRVMVGRLEMMTPQRESDLKRLLRQTGAEDPAVRNAAFAQIKQLGRFAEPALQRVLKGTLEPEVRAQAEKLLALLQPVK